MSTLYVHMGTTKTGSTAIQTFIYKNKELLSDKNFYLYSIAEEHPDHDPRRNGYFLSLYELDSETGKRNKKIENANRKNILNELLAMLNEGKNVIVTEESIYYKSFNFKGFWEDFKEIIVGNGHSLKLIVYMRRQDEFLKSYWKHKVRENYKLSFEEYVFQKKYSFCKLDYFTSLEKIAKVIGRENIMVRVYERGQFKGKEGNIFSDFMEALGLTITEDYVFPEGSSNPSIDYLCAETKRRLGNDEWFLDSKNFVRSALRTVTIENAANYKDPDCFFDTPEKLKNFLAEFEEENSNVAKYYLGREDGKMFLKEIDYDNMTYAKPFTEEELLENCGRIMIAMNARTVERVEHLKEIIAKRNETIEKRNQLISDYRNRKIVRLVDSIKGIFRKAPTVEPLEPIEEINLDELTAETDEFSNDNNNQDI